MKQREKPPPVVEKRQAPPKKAPPAQEPRAPEPTWIEPPPRAAEPAPRTKQGPIEVEPEATPSLSVPAVTLPAAPEPSRPPAPSPATVHEPSRPGEPAPAPARESSPASEPSPSREPSPSLAPAREPSLAPVPAHEPPRPLEPAPVIVAEPEPEFEAAPDARNFSVDATFGSWAKSGSDGGSRTWQLAYGVRLGYAVLPILELELELVRAGATAGSSFVSASTTHNLAALRVFYVHVVGDRLALLLGGGGGIAIAQTHYTLKPSTDPTTPETGIDATALKPVMQVTAAGRVRIFRGLEARAEVSVIARDGRLDLLPLLGAGWAF
jgi:hypothetical protein